MHWSICLSGCHGSNCICVSISKVSNFQSTQIVLAIADIVSKIRSLRTMRNYIHIQLCVTLGIAQIIFVAGIEPHLGKGIWWVESQLAVDWWLFSSTTGSYIVSFVWMLMEGVVLYVALVRVFIKYHARYIAAFTIASYGE